MSLHTSNEETKYGFLLFWILLFLFFYFFVFRLLYSMLPVSLDYPFFVATSVSLMFI